MEDRITVEVVYATPQRQLVIVLSVALGATVLQVILLSGILHHFPEIELQNQPIGIYGTPVTLDQPVAAGDRVEICRSLCADPRVIRRQRAMQLKR